MRHTPAQLKAVAERFAVAGALCEAVPYGSGHINDTYKCAWRADGRSADYILQRVNHAVFPNPPQLMDNVVRVTGHLQRKLAAGAGAEPTREALTVIPTRDGASYFRDAEGNFWRTYIFIAEARTFDVCTDLCQATEAARAFGRFQAALADLDGGRLHDTIPFFHHTPRRFAALEDAIAKDTHNRAASARDAIAFCLARRRLTTAITGLLESGAIPERTVHNDAKINNVMIDNATGRGICVIDLDTVMPGCALYDFGDMVRSVARTCEEDERDLTKVAMDPNIFEALVRGYLETASAFLTPLEIEHLPLAGPLITFNIGVRFLTDYLKGDVYFKTHRPGHNLDRARVQFKMIESMEAQEAAMRAGVARYRTG